MNGEPPARLCLDDGSVFEGSAFGSRLSAAGEVVFSTGIAGYPESLTDPSFRGQILVLTYPLIGNYGVPERTSTRGLLDHFESDRIQVAGLVVSWLAREPSHWSSIQSLDDWLLAEGVPGIQGVDTRALTQRLRTHGVMAGRIAVGDGSAPVAEGTGLVPAVSVREPRLIRSGRTDGPTVGVLDCGVKNNMLRLLLQRGSDVLRLPWDADPVHAAPRIDGLLVSNGPGDPKDVPRAVAATKRALDYGIPTFGICFGNQLVALAAGADTYKLPFGHRGQ
ncbi:MAG: carbamoyl phosphate synthase small subunit, partial [Gammaproteobacteria bacterium]|nr:carbamoyl phosphate synthase small subunit [Gammaproteobacteria bacterium]